MVDASNDDLINKKNRLSFDSISEKQEESSNSTAGKNSKLKSKISNNNNINNKSLRKSHDVSKDQININNISISKKKNSQSKNSIFSKKRKTRLFNNFEDKDKYKINRRETKKKTGQIILKRISFQQDNSQFFTNHLKDVDNRGSSAKNVESVEGAFYKSFLREKSLVSVSNSKLTGLTALYSNKNSVIGQTILKNQNHILSNSEYLDKKYFSNNKGKNTVLGKRKINLKNQRSMNFSNLFEKLKESYLFEKSEILLHKIKICYGFLAFFSFLSILLEIIDVIIFNKESEVFLNINYNITLINETNVNSYYFIKERKISKRENSIRIFNLIFSLLCFFLHLIIHYIKNSFDKETKKKKKRNNYYKYYNRRRRTTRLVVKDQNNNNSPIFSENRIKIISNDDFGTKSFVTNREIIKLVINCVISLAFYPPGINKIFVGIQDNTIYVYSLNSIFLLITFFKLKDIYFAIYYLCPFNNLLYKTICSSNMVKMDFKFMFRFLLNLYPKPFIFINFIIIGITVCIILYSFEYFSIDINGIWNKKGENGLKNFYNDIFLYFFFIIKNVHGNIRADTIIGSFVLLIGGTLGLVINSYLIYYINNMVEFKPEEEKAYSKLVKLLNPLNNEHKASNLIKIILLMKKMHIDNRNIEELYKSKKENNLKNIIRRNLNIRKSNYNFPSNDSENDSSNNVGNYEYKEKKKFIKYISTQFLLKAKLIIECKNFKNILLIARNYSLSFNDVLKTLEDKMNGNINQLNNKIEILIQNDQKYRNFMKYQENAMGKLKRVMIYQDFLLNYLISQNNQLSVEYIRHNKEYQNSFLKKSQNQAQGGKPRRMKSLINGSIFAFSRKPTKQSVEEEGEKVNKENKNTKVVFDTNPKKYEIKRLRSSILQKKTNINNINSLNRTRSPNFKSTRRKNKKSTKSLDDKKFKINSKRDKIIKIENNNLEKIRKKRRSLSSKQKIVMDKWKNLIGKK